MPYRSRFLLALLPALALAACADRAPTGVDPHPLAATAAASSTPIINEVMVDPAAVTDDVGEWIEIHNPASTSIDLKGWRIHSANDAVHTIATSVVIAAGGYAVLARNGTASKNGGVTAGYAYGTGLTLANASDWIALRNASGASVDSVAWASSVPSGATRGVSDPTADNPDVKGANWHTATSVYGKGDKGTPGARNDGYVAAPGPVVTVTVTPATAGIVAGATQAFSASAVDSNGTSVSTTYTWTTSNTSIASVNVSGVVTGLAAGTVAVRATAANGVFAEATLTVTAPSGGGGGTSSELIVKVLDIGQGDATYIANGTSRVFIDGGPDTASFRRHLDALGVRGGTVDVVVISHAHFDHYSGLRELFKTSNGIQVRYLFENRDAGTAVSLGELRDSIDSRVARGELIVRDTDDPCGDGRAVCTVTLNGGAKLHVMRPDPSASDANNRSTPVKLVGPDSASFSMWFAGDAEHEAQGWFDTGANYDVFPGMKVEVLKANHHGSCNGVSSRFVDLVNPALVTFSVSADNSYGHVHTQTKDLFARYGKPWYRTDQNGNITFRSPGTVGGGYTVSVDRGVQSEGGIPDRTSAQTACSTL
jgi:beta-lactamase superfamily II metal-dependent hydrolase